MRDRAAPSQTTLSVRFLVKLLATLKFSKQLLEGLLTHFNLNRSGFHLPRQTFHSYSKRQVN